MGPNRDLTDFSHVQVDRAPRRRKRGRSVLRELPARGIDVFGYMNNHFAGHSPASARDLQRLLGVTPVEPREIGEQISLF
jgi:uncharacterized protein YecE (DUF72 family)